MTSTRGIEIANGVLLGSFARRREGSDKRRVGRVGRTAAQHRAKDRIGLVAADTPRRNEIAKVVIVDGFATDRGGAMQADRCALLGGVEGVACQDVGLYLPGSLSGDLAAALGQLM